MNLLKEYLETSTIHGLSYIASTKNFVKLFWILTVLSGFSLAGFLIYQSFQEWEENPITTTVETLPISKITFPKVSVCPPVKTLTNLNYDLLNDGNMTLDNETRMELFKTALETLDMLNYEDVLQNMSIVSEKNRFYNWYNGYSTISLPQWAPISSGISQINLDTVREGSIK